MATRRKPSQLRMMIEDPSRPMAQRRDALKYLISNRSEEAEAELGSILESAAAADGQVHAERAKERAQTLAEYSLLIAVVGVGVVVPSMLLFRTALAGAFSDATDCILRTTC